MYLKYYQQERERVLQMIIEGNANYKLDYLKQEIKHLVIKKPICIRRRV